MAAQRDLKVIAPSPIVQIAWSVDDVDAAVEQWTAVFGIGPFFVTRHVEMEICTYRGAPTSFDHTAAFAQWGEFQVELMQQHGDYPSMLRDVCPAGQTKVVSYSWFVDDLDVETERMNAMGFETVFTCAYTDRDVRVAWFDTRQVLGAMVEVYQENPIIRFAYKRVAAAAANWTGERPLRGAEELAFAE